MWKQQKANTQGQPREWQPLLYKRHGPAERQGNRLSPVQATRGVSLCTGSQLAWEYLGEYERVEIRKVQEGHGAHTCSELLKGLSPYLHENRPVASNWRNSKWISARREAEGIPRPAQQAARGKQLCPDDDEEAMLHRLRKRRQEVQELREKFYDERLRAVLSSLEKDQESPTESRCILQETPNPSLEAAADSSKQHSACSVTKGAAAETPKPSELVSLDQVLAELGPASGDSLSCDALVKELLENWDPEELPDREAAGERDSEPQSTFLRPPPDTEGCVIRDRSRDTPEHAADSQGTQKTAGLTKVSAGEAQNHADVLAHLCSESGNSPASDALLKDLLEKWEEEELQDRAAAGLRDSEPESVLFSSRRRGGDSTVSSGQQSL